jgi:hypothetical protein
MKTFDSLRQTLFGKSHRTDRSHPLRGKRSSCRRSFEALEDRRLLTVMNVTTFADVLDDTDGQLSLREAVIEANSSPGDDEIVLQDGVYTLTRVGSDEDGAATGDLDITDVVGTLTISGASSSGTSATPTTIDADALSDRVIHVLSGVSLDISRVVITNGSSDFGGGIYNDGELTVSSDARIERNGTLATEAPAWRTLMACCLGINPALMAEGSTTTAA